MRIDALVVEDFEPAPYPEATIRVDCSSGTYVRTLAADLGTALGGCAHLGDAAPAARRRRSTLDEARPLDADRGRSRRASCSRRRPRCATSNAVVVDGEQARAVAHGATFAARRAARRPRRRRARSRSSTSAASCSRSTSGAARGVKPAVVLAAAGARRERSCRDPARASDRRPVARGRAVTIGAFDGVHLGHQAVLRLVRELADARGLRADRAHLRPAPGRGRAARVGAEAAHHARPEARAARGDRRGRRVPRARRSTRRAARSRPRTSSSEVLASVLARAPRRGRRRLPLRLPPPRRRRRCCSAWAPSSASRCSGSGSSRRPIERAPDGGVPYSSTRVRELLARGRRRAARPRSSAGPHEVRGPVERGDARGRELGFPTANVARARAHLPPGRRRLRRHVHRRRRRRAAGRDLARPPADVLRRAGHAACSRRYLLDFDGDLYGQHARVRFLRPPPRPGALRRRSTPRRADAPRRRRAPVASAPGEPERPSAVPAVW